MAPRLRDGNHLFFRDIEVLGAPIAPVVILESENILGCCTPLWCFDDHCFVEDSRVGVHCKHDRALLEILSLLFEHLDLHPGNGGDRAVVSILNLTITMKKVARTTSGGRGNKGASK